jgi:hypothetical protein
MPVAILDDNPGNVSIGILRPLTIAEEGQAIFALGHW